jgi:hypothetical protein
MGRLPWPEHCPSLQVRQRSDCIDGANFLDYPVLCVNVEWEGQQSPSKFQERVFLLLIQEWHCHGVQSVDVLERFV